MPEYIRPTPKRRRKVAESIIPASEPRIVLYARVSKKELIKENQIQEFETRFPGLVYEVHEETAKGDKDKPRLYWLLNRLPANSTIYVAAIDRLSRNMIELLTLAKIAIDNKIKIQSLREGDLDLLNPVVLAVFGWVAEMEKKNLSERVKHGIARARKERALGEKEWGIGIRKKKAEREGTEYVKPAGRPVRQEFMDALPDIKKLRAKGLTLKEIAANCTMKYKVNFTVQNISNLLRRGHG